MTLRPRVAGLVEWLPALVVFLLVIGTWEGLVRALHVQQFLLPKPSTIVRVFWTQRHVLWPAGWYTFKEALGGFAIGSGAGVVAATVVGRFQTAGKALMPIFIAANAVPIIAFAPIFGAWFDPISPQSKMAIAAVLCFLPVMVNTLRGLQSARPRQVELMRSYAASELQIWRRVRVPTALPFLFTALKVASVLSMIGAIVGEYFGGAMNALGVTINTDAQVFQFDAAWAGILVASLLGIALYGAVAAAERVVVRRSPGVPGS
ncbi:MAG TPA: ABC transporter permease [Gaiellaceae bacterium]|jgi:NitT/TauT family transport system permease protein|nr:ABC transporter permease [Gaiellaceae bacterium]